MAFLLGNPRITKLTCESKVSNFEDALAVEEEVGELEVAVDYVLGVRVANLGINSLTPLISCSARHFTSPSLKLPLSMLISLISRYRSISQYSNTRKTLSALRPTTTYLRPTMLGWLASCRRIFTSRREVMGNPS